MTSPRQSQSEIAAAKKAELREKMDQDIAEGRLIVRQMTPEERELSNARRGVAQPDGKRPAKPRRR